MDYLQKNWGLDGKRAVVTGASRGIGRGVASALASTGAEILVHYNQSEEAARSLVEEIQSAGGKAWFVQADLTDSAQVARMFREVEERWRGLDILVNNTGSIIRHCELEDFTDELMEAVIRVNFHTALYSIRAAIPLLRKGQNPSIVNVSSIAAHSGGAAGSSVYSAMKGAIVSLTRGLAKELAPIIRVNGIAPAAVPTEFLKTQVSEERFKEIAGAAPLERLGKPEDNAAAVVFLCGEGSSYITGELIDVCGGRRFVY